MFVKCSCQNCNETISFEDAIAGMSISCPCCATATTLVAPPRRKKKSIFDENDWERLNQIDPPSNHQRLELRFWNQLDLLKTSLCNINIWREEFYDGDSRRSVVWTHYKNVNHIDKDSTNPESIPIGEGEIQMRKLYGEQEKRKTTFVFECVGGIQYLKNIHCHIKGIETKIDHEKREIQLVEYPTIPMVYYVRKDKINYCGFEIPEGVYCYYQRTIQVTPQLQERKWFCNEDGIIKTFETNEHDGFNMWSFKKYFLDGYDDSYQLEYIPIRR